MNPTRRHLLLASAATLCAPAIIASPARPRIIVVGGGWGGLAAARQLAPSCDVLLVERSAAFLSLPLSNRWLAGRADDRRLQQDRQAAAAALGYRLLQADVLAIERTTRQVATSAGRFAYDWLVLAPGIAEDDAALFGGDRAAAAETRRRFASAYTTGPELAGLKEKLAAFSQGEFLLALPPAPYRCPPAPYERAVIIAQAIKARKLKARLTVVEPNAPWPAYQRVFADLFREQVSYLPNTRLRQFDPGRRVATLDIDDLPFNEAIVMPPQQAAALCRESGLCGRDSAWAAVHPRHFQAVDDERIFVVGDSVGTVSPLFGHYPKTGQIAARMGQIAAAEIHARVSDRPGEPELPESTCFAYLSLEPAQFTRLDNRYRVRGDGVLVQTASQHRENNPQGEDDAWLDAWHATLFGPAART